MLNRNILGFTRCIQAWLSKMGIKRNVDPIATHLGKVLSFASNEKQPKMFKVLLATTFSKFMGQELPKGSEHFHGVYPWPMTQSFKGPIFRALARRSRRQRRMWDLLQCKSLADVVPNSMIQSTYEGHKEALAAVVETPPELLKELRDFARPWAERCVALFSNKTKQAKQSAYYGLKRSTGGIKGHLRKVVKAVGHDIRPHRSVRMEPVVVALTGKPGCGKSTAFRAICKNIAQSFGLPTKYPEEYAYWRSTGTEHWDGYNNQLISGCDDFGAVHCVTHTSEEPQPEKKELIQLVSNVPYILPMADLKDKGKQYNSEFHCISANRLSVQPDPSITDTNAYWRRLGRPIWHMVRDGRHADLYKICVEKHENCNNAECMENSKNARAVGFSGHSSLSGLHKACVSSIIRFRCFLDEVPKIISEWALATWREKNSHELGRDGYRFQPFEESEAFNVGFGYEFQIPDELPENRVEAIALPEPLKVRMITKSQPLAWALKPVQLAMFKALTKYKCMRPCIDGDYDPSCILRSGPGYRLLSGDYSAATDGLHYDASQVVLSELVGAFKVIDPALARLIEWEGGVHIIEYPKKTGLSDCYQTNGQLMGSLLSFPILCIINAFTYCKASGESLEDAQALIHGDDIAFHHTRDVIRKWKQIAHNVGLEPSVGKNYDSKEWVSIDSQFYQKRGSSLVKAPTGKFSCAIRSAEETATYAKALEEGGFSKGFLRYFSKSQLMRTPRSLDVPVSHGGLGTEFSSVPTTTDKLIYSFERYNRRFRDVTRLHDGRRLVRVPSYAAKRAGAKVVRETVSPDQLEVDLSVAENPGFPWKEFNSYKKKMLSTSKNVRHLQAIDLPSAIPLELCKPVTVIASDNYDYHRLKNLSNQV